MKTIALLDLSLLFISCGKVSSSGSKNSKYSEPIKGAIKAKELSGVHTGKPWTGKLAIMTDSDLFEKPALSFDIVSDTVENPCFNYGTNKLFLMVTVLKNLSDAPKENGQYINFYEQESGRLMSSPDVEFELKKEGDVVKELGIAFHIDDKEYDVEGFV